MKGKMFLAASALVVAACSSQRETMSDELKKDLEVAESSDGLSLASTRGQSQQVVSAIEQSPPAPKKLAASQRAIRYRRAETRTAAPVFAEAETPTDETELQGVSDAPVATNDDAPVAPRPTPVATTWPAGDSEGRIGSGSVGVGTGVIIGTVIGVVLRGGSVGEDHCEEHDRRAGRRSPPISINSRVPVIRGTFPGRIANRVRN